MRIDEILAKFPDAKRNGQGWKAKCPAHEDSNPSLSISEGDNGATLLKCHAGCQTDAVCRAVGIGLADLFAKKPSSRKGGFNIVTSYDYVDEGGKLIYQVCRLAPKGFRQRRPDATAPDGWTWKTAGVPRVLFRLPELIAAVADGRPVYVAEGEKDCLALVAAGFAATCNAGGAGKWPGDCAGHFKGADVFIIADKDDAGRKHAQAIAENLHGVAASIRVLELPDTSGKPVKDAADFFAAGGQAADLDEIAQAAPLWNGTNSKEPPPACQAPNPQPPTQGRAVSLPDVDLWPEAVNGADVLSQIAATFSRYVALPAGAANALALWVAHAHAFKAFLHSPRLNISSPEKGCGKTTLRDVVGVLVPRPLLTENLSVAVLFRLVDAHEPTILADEYDAWIQDNEELRGLLNSGHRRGGQAYRCVGDNNEVRGFQVFSPAALCGIGALPGTLHDRSIVVRLERAKQGEIQQSFDSRRTAAEQELCRKLARWSADNMARLEACEPVLPANAFNRLADNWRPLFAVAEIVGGDWPQRAADAFAKVTYQDDADAQGIGTMLLADIRQVLSDGACERIFSKALVERLCSMSDRPWSEAHRGKPINETWLAKRLSGFSITSQTLRIKEDRAKGYTAADFKEAFARYLPDGAVKA